MSNPAVTLAQSILDLDEENRYLRLRVAELEEFERKFNDLLTQTLQHNERMATGLLSVGLKMAEEGKL